jgi:hypothetical protein
MASTGFGAVRRLIAAAFQQPVGGDARQRGARLQNDEGWNPVKLVPIIAGVGLLVRAPSQQADAVPAAILLPAEPPVSATKSKNVLSLGEEAPLTEFARCRMR